MSTEQLFNNIRGRFQSLLSTAMKRYQSLHTAHDSKTNLERLQDAILIETNKQAELQRILSAKTQLHKARVANQELRNQIASVDKPATKWKPMRSENI